MNEKPLYNAIRKMDYNQLEKFSKRIREYIYNTVTKNTGHLASNLGTVELTLALYRIFDPEEDIIIWDTSHQAYTHKLLTGRWGSFKTLRQKNGISGFTNIFESKYDYFGAGHAGTSIAVALGYELGFKKQHIEKNVIAILGDGAMTSGMVLESLNQLKSINSNMKIILLNNEMSISPNVGALAKLLNKVRISYDYYNFKEKLKESLEVTEVGQDIEGVLKKLKDGIKHTVYNNTLGIFEDMGIKYYGPVDGHNIKKLEHYLEFIKNYNDGPCILHLKTIKGKGLSFAEENPTKFHGISNKIEKNISYSKVVGHTLNFLAKNHNFITFTAAMENGTGLNILKDNFPEKVIDLGITEPSIVTAAGAVRLSGIFSVVDIYSTFMQRAFDSIVHDIALQKIPVLFLLDRAGIVGEDGPTHHGVFDISYLRLIPDIEIYTPLNAQDLANMIYTSFKKGLDKPTFIRFPRGGENINIDNIIENLKIVDYNWKLIKKANNKNILLVVGQLIEEYKDLWKELNATIIGIRSIKNIDNHILNLYIKNDVNVITIEENSLKGGFNEEIKTYILKNNISCNLFTFGIDDFFIPQGTRKELLDEFVVKPEKLKNIILSSEKVK
ncbi:1-deoxy-D-xylulose-5-phosphate synthase [Marinitoga hydrogenitolerans DSM 16785]|uniref:1-deoxy-D-xylulose-5-phosphate synthase n=1 Tax=Marinitoga hydrogenitolerans (strain DSM 16785 / JCM 12826 / AT1271) TaxID=1122195 RepID=A0A1M4XRD2_MARH1|nr:1-deoxy-D-xylulose-5-phosphate synthase [Marinitoga hydrogenitolerans]SHE96005.1 1-deoxy-D-xylulose-5-phosphate synthase [Marinitoga hydrogenitolerans DSM 16785]